MKRLLNLVVTVIFAAFFLGGLASCGGGNGSNTVNVDPDTGGMAVEDLLPGAQKTGSLSPTDEASPEFSYIDLYMVTLPETGSLTVKMLSTAIDSHIYIFRAAVLDEPDMTLWMAPAYLIAEDDDSAGGVNGTDAVIGIELPAGAYLIVATSHFPEETGSYTLISSFVPLGAIVQLTPIDAISTALTSGDIKYPDSNGTYADRYTLTLSEGGTLEIGMTSDVFDSYLYLYSVEALNVPLWDSSYYIDENDGFVDDGFWNAYISINLTAGEYVIVGTSYFEEDTGVYDLSTIFSPNP